MIKKTIKKILIIIFLGVFLYSFWFIPINLSGTINEESPNFVIIKILDDEEKQYKFYTEIELEDNKELVEYVKNLRYIRWPWPFVKNSNHGLNDTITIFFMGFGDLNKIETGRFNHVTIKGKRYFLIETKTIYDDIRKITGIKDFLND